MDDSDEDEEEAINTGEEEQEASSPHLKKRKATGSRKKTARKVSTIPILQVFGAPLWLRVAQFRSSCIAVQPLQRAFADAAEAEEDAEDQAEGSNVVMESGVAMTSGKQSLLCLYTSRKQSHFTVQLAGLMLLLPCRRLPKSAAVLPLQY